MMLAYRLAIPLEVVRGVFYLPIQKSNYTMGETSHVPPYSLCTIGLLFNTT
jgi:hypothetical protein